MCIIQHGADPVAHLTGGLGYLLPDRREHVYDVSRDNRTGLLVAQFREGVILKAGKPLAGVDLALPSRLVLGVILPRRFAKRHLGRRLVFPLSQYVAPVDLDRLAKLAGLLADLRQSEQLRAAQSDVLTLTVALQTKGPRCPSTPIDLQKQAVTILIGARIRKSGLDRNRREFAHGNLPPHFLPTFWGTRVWGKDNLPPHFPHTTLRLQANCPGRMRTMRG